MKSAYRPGLVPQGVVRPRLGLCRGMLLSDSLEKCPSLANDLVFSSEWRGSQCINSVTGIPLTNSASPVLPSAIDNDSNIAGSFVQASNQYLVGPSISLADRDFTIATKVLFVPVSYTYGTILSRLAGSNNQEFDLYIYNNTIRFETYGSGTNKNTIIASPSGGVTPYWHNIVAQFDKTVGVQRVYVDGVVSSSAISYQILASPGSMLIGIDTPSSGWGMSGAIGLTRIWNRILSAQEIAFL